jgi:hypothetical protein
MNVVGLKPGDDLPPPPPPPKIVEEKSKLPPVPLDTTDLMPPSLNPNGSYPPSSLYFLFWITIEAFVYSRPQRTGDANKSRRLSLPATVTTTRSQVEKDEPTNGTS